MILLSVQGGGKTDNFDIRGCPELVCRIGQPITEGVRDTVTLESDVISTKRVTI